MDNNLNAKESHSQQRAILAYLQSGESLTALDALNLFGSMACSKRISEIIGKGYPIQKEWILTRTGKRIMRYSMPQVSTAKSL